MNKILLSSIIFLLTFVGCQENFDERLKRETQEFTRKHCPTHIEEGNTLDSLTYNMNKGELIRWHTLSGIMDTPSAKTTFLNNSNSIKAYLLKELKNDVEKNYCKEKNIKFTYIYSSASTKKSIFKITFNPKDYQR